MRLLLNWWLISAPSQLRLPEEAERSLAIARVSNPFSAAVSRPTQVTIAVIGTWPLIAPAALASNSSGSSRRVAASHGSSAAAAVRAIAAASPIENRAVSAPERRSTSIATAESLPPPTATSARRGSGGCPAASPAGVWDAAVPKRGRGSAGSRFVYASSPRPSE